DLDQVLLLIHQPRDGALHLEDEEAFVYVDHALHFAQAHIGQGERNTIHGCGAGLMENSCVWLPGNDLRLPGDKVSGSCYPPIAAGRADSYGLRRASAVFSMTVSSLTHTRSTASAVTW